MALITLCRSGMHAKFATFANVRTSILSLTSDGHSLLKPGNKQARVSTCRQIHIKPPNYAQGTKNDASSTGATKSGWLDRMFSNRIETGNEPHSRLL